MKRDEQFQLETERYRTFESGELQVGQRVRLDPFPSATGSRIFEFGTVEALRDGRRADVLLARRRDPFVKITALGVRVRAICSSRDP